MRKPLIAGNWKLNKTIAESTVLASQLAQELNNINNREIVIAPIFTALSATSKVLGNSQIQLAAQNCYPENQGAYTGELSPQFLADAGCQYIIIGHSERRQLLNETDAFINQKLIKTIEAGLKPILCIGETLQQRESGQMEEVLSQQIKGGLINLVAEKMATVVIAYEPIWAIGTGKTATTAQAQDAHLFIRKLLHELFDSKIAAQTRILYGGSVKPDNIDGLMQQEDIDGALVGGASLNCADFVRIVNFAD